ncbi:MAG: enoyl-CoA hydratase/isomerase family protein [Syntrophales bacterium]
MGENVLIEKRENVSIIKLNLPQKLNALEKKLRTDLKSALIQFHNDDAAHAAILTGQGKAFCAGGSLEEIKDGINTVNGVNLMMDYGEIITMMTKTEKPIIAAVNGLAVGAGLSLALACDIVISSSSAVFASVFSKVGLVPDMGALYFLPRVVGMHRAKELIFTSRMIKAEEAMQMGIVNQVVSPEELGAYAFDLAKKIADGPTAVYGFGKKILSRSLESNLQDILQYETYAQSICFQSQDHREGVQAFYEKRTPVFTGK